FVEHLVEITDTEEDQRIAMARLRLAPLPHQWGLLDTRLHRRDTNQNYPLTSIRPTIRAPIHKSNSRFARRLARILLPCARSRIPRSHASAARAIWRQRQTT